ncbi:MAG: hypothetical protein J6X67_03200 [Treponema sp.]|nr:hypothetical protein [Treponema sp.]
MEKRYEEFIGGDGYLRQFLIEWISRGEISSSNEEYSQITTFFCYFVAFNYLFNTFSYNVYRDKDCGEKGQIKRFIEFCSGDGKRFITKLEAFNPFPLLSPDAEIFTYVKNMRYCKNSNKQDFNPSKNVIDLFLNIYQVRCNLFHGSKAMETSRDKNLVKESNIVLKNLLDCFV